MLKVAGWLIYGAVITVLYMFLTELLINFDDRYDWGIEWGYGLCGAVLVASILLWRKTRKVMVMGIVVAAAIGLVLLAGESAVGWSDKLQDLIG